MVNDADTLRDMLLVELVKAEAALQAADDERADARAEIATAMAAEIRTRARTRSTPYISGRDRGRPGTRAPRLCPRG